MSHYDITVLPYGGFRTKEDQDLMIANGKSETPWPRSKHNVDKDGNPRPPSCAVDIAPYPIDWNDTYRFIYLAGCMRQAAARYGVKLRWGGNWDGDDLIINDQSFNDLVHFELAGGIIPMSIITGLDKWQKITGAVLATVAVVGLIPPSCYPLTDGDHTLAHEASKRREAIKDIHYYEWKRCDRTTGLPNDRVLSIDREKYLAEAYGRYEEVEKKSYPLKGMEQSAKCRVLYKDEL